MYISAKKLCNPIPRKKSEKNSLVEAHLSRQRAINNFKKSDKGILRQRNDIPDTDDDDVMSDVSEEDLVIREIGSDRDESGDEELMRPPAEKVNRYGRGKLQSHRLGEETEKCQKFCQNCNENEMQIFCEDCDLRTNPNAVGSFIHGENLKPGQNKILDNNIKKLNTNYASLDELKVELKDNECEIYDQTGRTLLKVDTGQFKVSD
ncbi:unnamed protein product [Mytilus coruscus]|uniref:Uncharacterized protein n=1 Tax=Mytilus coruscus TaxID=42192 RepID=A0A6J8ECM6_MYTCO|nr:unnamed protein product [Mytilus coruscus]